MLKCQMEDIKVTFIISYNLFNLVFEQLVCCSKETNDSSDIIASELLNCYVMITCIIYNKLYWF